MGKKTRKRVVREASDGQGEVNTESEDSVIEDPEINETDQLTKQGDMVSRVFCENDKHEEEYENMNTEDGDLSLCDASFNAINSVPTSGHTYISKCTEKLEFFLEAVNKHNSREDDFDFEESLGILTVEEINALWVSLNDYLNESIPNYVNKVDTELHHEVVVGVVLIAKLCISLPSMQADTCPNTLLQTATLLHTTLLFVDDVKLSNNICLLLEAWYTLEMPDKDSMTSNVLVTLLKKALSVNGSKADVKRIWSLHQTILGFRLNEMENLRNLMVSTIGSNNFLNSGEGVRWLVFLFSLSPDIVSRLHKHVKLVLSSFGSNKSACNSLGEIYHKAWLSSGGAFRTKLEQDCLQDLMYKGVLACRVKGGISTAVLRVLSVLHHQKRSIPTQNMLARLYDPILWRHLKVANANVRLNACEHFLSCYPIEDQELSREERDSCLEMQHTTIVSLIRDEDPVIRSTAINGVCRIFGAYWLLVPSEVINQVVNLMVKETVWDSSSTRVRLASIAGIKTMLDSPHSHVYLKAVLPRLADCLHDTNEGVRGAMLDLLLAVKGVRSIKFWTICPLEHLLARLEIDKPFLCRRIVKLLFNSYFPSDQGDETKLERCIHLVQTSKAASRSFYQYSGEVLGIDETVRFMVAILTSVKIFVKAKMGKGQDDDEDKENGGKKRRRLYNSNMMSENDDASISASDISNISSTVLENTTINSGMQNDEDENSAVDEDHPYNDISVVSGMLDIVCVLWMVRNSDIAKPENDQYRAVLEKKSGRWLTLLFKFFRGTSACGTVVYLASFLPERVVSPVASFCLARVKEEDEWRTYVDCLCNWRKGDGLLEIVADGLRSGMGSNKSSKGVRFVETQSKDVQLSMAVKLLEYMIGHHANRTILIAKNRPMLEECLEVCLTVMETIEQKLGFTDNEMNINKQLAQVVGLAGRLSVLLHPDNALSQMEEFLAWSDRELVPVIMPPSDTNTSHIARTRGQVSLCEGVLNSLCDIVFSCLSLGISDPEFTVKALDWAVQLLHSGGSSQVCGILRLICEAAKIAGLGIDAGWNDVYQDKVPVCFAKILSWLTNYSEKLSEIEGGVGGIKKGLVSIVKIYKKYDAKDKESWEDIIEVMVVAAISVIKKKIKSIGEVTIPHNISDIEGVGALLIDAILKQSGGGDMISIALKSVLNDIENGDIGGTTGAILAVVSVVKSSERESIIDIVENCVEICLEKEEVEGERMGERELLGEVRSALIEVRGRIGYQGSQALNRI